MQQWNWKIVYSRQCVLFPYYFVYFVNLTYLFKNLFYEHIKKSIAWGYKSNLLLVIYFLMNSFSLVKLYKSLTQLLKRSQHSQNKDPLCIFFIRAIYTRKKLYFFPLLLRPLQVNSVSNSLMSKGKQNFQITVIGVRTYQTIFYLSRRKSLEKNRKKDLV